jgi:hypothetical protein
MFINSVLYINVKYTKYRDFFSLKRNVTEQLIKIIVLGPIVKVTYPQPRTHVWRNAITFVSWFI